MDWSNERYVRLYTRDTTTWKRLGWDGQCVLMHLLRKLDRSGTLDLSGLEAWEAVMLHIGATEDVAKRGVEAILRTETAVATAGKLIFPSFIEAQECSKTDKQRQRESRDRRAATGKEPPTSVTVRDGQSQDVTEPSQSVTASHEQSQPVTFGHSVLCSAVQCREGECESAPAARPLQLLPHEPDPEPKPAKPRDDAKLLWAATLKGECSARKIPAPSIGAKVRDDVLRMAREHAANTGESFPSVLRAWIVGGLEAHLATGKAVQWALKDFRPYGPRVANTQTRDRPANDGTDVEFNADGSVKLRRVTHTW